MAKVITLGMLIEKNACQEQVNLFQQYFDESVEVTEEICIKYSNDFAIDWLADNMLNKKQCELYYTIRARAREEYSAIIGAASEDYYAIREIAHIKNKKERARAFCLIYNS